MNRQYVIEVNASNFETVVLQSDVPVIVDFWASWCGPCISFAPVFDKLAEQFLGQAVKFVKIDVDQESELADRYNIHSIPTVTIFKSGNVLNKDVDIRTLSRVIEELLKNSQSAN